MSHSTTTKQRPAEGLLTSWTLTALVAGNMIGSGIFSLPSSLASFGSISLIAWVFTAFGALMLALIFAKLGAVLPREGGAYAYCREAFGDFIGFQVAYTYWIALWVGNAALVVAFTGYLSFFWPLLAQNPWSALSVNLTVLWGLTFLNSRGLRYAGMLQIFLTCSKLIPLVGVACIGLFYINLNHFTDFNLSGQSNFIAFGGAATLTFWSFLGLESASIPAGQIKDPKRTIPRATILGVSTAAILYILNYVALIGLVPMRELADSPAPYAHAIQSVLGSAASSWVAGLAAISCLGSLNGWILIQGQIPFSAAKDQLFPSTFRKKTSKGIPIVGLISSSILISVLLLLQLNKNLISQFNTIALIATLAALLPYFFTTMAALVLFMKYPSLFQKQGRLIYAAIVAILGGLYAFWTIASAGKEIISYGCLLLLSSLPVYVWRQWNVLKNVKTSSDITKKINVQ